jgi:hypothetical protein
MNIVACQFLERSQVEPELRIVEIQFGVQEGQIPRITEPLQELKIPNSEILLHIMKIHQTASKQSSTSSFPSPRADPFLAPISGQSVVLCGGVS